MQLKAVKTISCMRRRKWRETVDQNSKVRLKVLKLSSKGVRQELNLVSEVRLQELGVDEDIVMDSGGR